MRISRDRALKSREITADMVEHAVEHDTQATAMRGFDEGVEISVVAQTLVDCKMIDGVVATRSAG
jgi:predicted transcriptional regulator of viral defense system